MVLVFCRKITKNVNFHNMNNKMMITITFSASIWSAFIWKES